MPWKLPDTDDGLLALAKTYPFAAPGHSYLFRDGAARPLQPGSGEAALFAERVPVLAHGSNRSPEQLRRKYGDGAEIPVSLGWLADYDVVYSAHITQYGAVASTLQHSPGSRVRIAINWLTETQLTRMHETEGPSTYQYGRMTSLSLSLEAGPAASLAEAFIYFSRNGCLARDGRPVGMAAVTTEQRSHAPLGQVEALTHVRDRYRASADLDRMILEAIRDKALRLALVAEMKAEAVPSASPHFAPLVE